MTLGLEGHPINRAHRFMCSCIRWEGAVMVAAALCHAISHRAYLVITATLFVTRFYKHTTTLAFV